jgi:hypothetical protein
MSTEYLSENQKGKKPASEMSVEELQPTGENAEVGLELDTAETHSSSSPEDKEKVSEQIDEAERELSETMVELSENFANAETALTEAEEALTQDPDNLEAKLVIERLSDLGNTVLSRLESLKTILTGATVTAMLLAPEAAQASNLLSEIYWMQEELGRTEVSTLIGVLVGGPAGIAIYGIAKGVSALRDRIEKIRDPIAYERRVRRRRLNRY